MTISFALVDTSAERHREADRRQAEYYWRVLAEAREAVQQKLAKDELDLAGQRSESGFEFEARSLRREIRRKQNELSMIDRLIDALEQRLLTAQG